MGCFGRARQNELPNTGRPKQRDGRAGGQACAFTGPWPRSCFGQSTAAERTRERCWREMFGRCRREMRLLRACCECTDATLLRTPPRRPVDNRRSAYPAAAEPYFVHHHIHICRHIHTPCPGSPFLHHGPSKMSRQSSRSLKTKFPVQKATKSLAAANTRRLNQTLYMTLAVHLLWWFLRALLFRSSFTRRAIGLYLLFSAPQLLVQLYFERLSRPTLTPDGSVKRAGEDLDAKGLTEYMWDVVYWTYGCIVFAAILGDSAWWLWAVIPAYSVYAAYTTYMGVTRGFQDPAAAPQSASTTSKRQAKLEKRGGQKVQYR